MKKICTFLGHKNTPTEIYDDLVKQIISVIKVEGVTQFFLGSHGNFHDMSFRAVLEAKKIHPEIEMLSVLSAMPTKNTFISKSYDGSIYPDGLESIPPRFGISFRNKWMADTSDIAIGYIRDKSGGAATAYFRAVRQNKVCINLCPKENQNF